MVKAVVRFAWAAGYLATRIDAIRLIIARIHPTTPFILILIPVSRSSPIGQLTKTVFFHFPFLSIISVAVVEVVVVNAVVVALCSLLR